MSQFNSTNQHLLTSVHTLWSQCTHTSRNACWLNRLAVVVSSITVTKHESTSLALFSQLLYITVFHTMAYVLQKKGKHALFMLLLAPIPAFCAAGRACSCMPTGPGASSSHTIQPSLYAYIGMHQTGVHVPEAFVVRLGSSCSHILLQEAWVSVGFCARPPTKIWYPCHLGDSAQSRSNG